MIDKTMTATEGESNAAGNAAQAEGAKNAQTDKNNAAEGGNGTYIHRFKKPYEFDGKKFEALNFYFDRLTGHDMLKVEQEMQDNSEFAVASEISKSFQCRIAARAANVGSDVIFAMPLRDFNKITNAARSFLLDLGL